MVPGYRLRVRLTYEKTTHATAALKAVKAVLVEHGREEVATRDGRDVALLIPGGMTQAQAIPLANALVAATATGPKSGKVSTVQTV